MKTSLIISTFNWPDALKMVLKSVLNQTILVDEIIIADDGSTKTTKLVIDNFSKLSSIPLIHSWHEDLGFRKSVILNKAFSMATGDYIIQIDGDIILHPKFIQDHINNAKKKHFIHGSRVLLNKSITLRRLNDEDINFNFFNFGLSNRINTIRSPFLSFLFQCPSTSLSKTRGCNFSCWKKDFEEVNGYNEDMVGWGFEDTELSARLINNSIFKTRLKFLALTYHLFHSVKNKAAADDLNIKILNHTIKKNLKYCENGLRRVN